MYFGAQKYCKNERQHVGPFPFKCTAFGLKILSKLDIRDKCYETENLKLKPKIMLFNMEQHQVFPPEVQDVAVA